MTFSYDDAALSTTLYRIRLEIGDTDQDHQLLSDDEINQVISEQSEYFVQVAKCCRLVASKFANLPQNVRFGRWFQENRTEIYNRYMELAKMYEAKASNPWVGSIDSDTKTDNEDDTDLVTPRFKRGMFDNS